MLHGDIFRNHLAHKSAITIALLSDETAVEETVLKDNLIIFCKCSLTNESHIGGPTLCRSVENYRRTAILYSNIANSIANES